MSLHPGDPFVELAARTSSPGERVLSALREEQKRDSSPRRALSRLQRVGLSVLSLIAGLALTSAGALVNSPRTFLIAAAALCLSVSGLLLAGAVPSAGSMLGTTVRRGLLAGLSIVGFTALALHADAFLSFEQFFRLESVHRAGVCATHALLSGVIGAAGLMYLWRRTDPYSPGLTGALLGFLGGLVGTLSVSLLCANNEGMHITLGHGVGLLILSGAGVWCGRKWLTP